MEEYELTLGDFVQDRVTGLKGIATSKTTFLNGCVQVEITPKLKSNDLGAPEKVMGCAIDIQQLKRIGVGLNTAPRVKKVKGRSTGGRPSVVKKRAY